MTESIERRNLATRSFKNEEWEMMPGSAINFCILWFITNRRQINLLYGPFPTTRERRHQNSKPFCIFHAIPRLCSPSHAMPILSLMLHAADSITGTVSRWTVTPSPPRDFSPDPLPVITRTVNPVLGPKCATLYTAIMWLTDTFNVCTDLKRQCQITLSWNLYATYGKPF